MGAEVAVFTAYGALDQEGWRGLRGSLPQDGPRHLSCDCWSLTLRFAALGGEPHLGS
jgi:hypothetical protein